MKRGKSKSNDLPDGRSGKTGLIGAAKSLGGVVGLLSSRQQTTLAGRKFQTCLNWLLWIQRGFATFAAISDCNET